MNWSVALFQRNSKCLQKFQILVIVTILKSCLFEILATNHLKNLLNRSVWMSCAFERHTRAMGKTTQFSTISIWPSPKELCNYITKSDPLEPVFVFCITKNPHNNNKKRLYNWVYGWIKFFHPFASSFFWRKWTVARSWRDCETMYRRIILKVNSHK